MKYTSAALALLAGTFVFSQVGQAAAPIPSPPLIKFKAETPLKIPGDIHFGETPAVAVNSKGHVFVVTRGDLTGPAFAPNMTRMYEFDQNGKYIREIGKHLYGFVYPHQVRIDKDDNMWVVDKGSNMIFTFNPQGRVIDVFGRLVEATEWRSLEPTNVAESEKALPAYPGIFNQQTDVAWDKKGNFYVSDGYINARVVKISKEGNWIKTWGERGTGPGQFLEPHQLVIDGNDRVYVGDRGNARIQVFDTEGKFLHQFTVMGQVPPGPGGEMPAEYRPEIPHAYPDRWPWGASSGIVGKTGAPMALCITPPGPNQVLYIADSNPSRIYRVSLEGKVLGMLGDGGTKLGEFDTTHQLTCPDDHTIWAADMFNWRVQKITMQD